MIKKLIQILSKRQKTSFIFIFLFMLISVMFEMLSVGMVFPVLKLLFDFNYLEKIKNYLPIILQSIDNINLIYLILILFLVIYFLKSLIILFIQITIARFSADIGRDISQRLYKSYLNKDYSFYTNINSSVIIRNILTESSNIFGLIFHFNNFLIELLILISIIIVLFLFEPTNTLFFCTILVLVTFFYIKFNKRKIEKIASVRSENDSLRIKKINDGVSLIKEIKIYNKIDFFLNEFSIVNFHSYESTKRLKIFQVYPRILLEQLVIIFIVILTIILNNKGLNFSELVATIGIYIAALLRIFPSSSRVITSFQGFFYNLPSVYNIYDDLTELKINKQLNVSNGKKLNFDNDIIFENLTFFYPSSKSIVLDKFKCIIRKNSINIIAGKTGSGKTTLVNLILGLLVPKSGNITLGGVDINQNLSSWQNSISYVPQSINLLDDTIARNIAFGTNDIDYDLLKECINSVELNDFISSSALGLETIVGEKGIKISGGQAQRIAIARALYRKPSVIVLDEATNALDNKTEELIFKTISNLKKKMTIIIITHNINNIKFADNIISLDNK